MAPIRGRLSEPDSTYFDQRTSKFTALPVTIFWPGAGFCVMIMLAALGSAFANGAEGADCESPEGGGGNTLTFPTLSPASCNASIALPNGCPVRFGMT